MRKLLMMMIILLGLFILEAELKIKELTPRERAVIEDKGTEMPFSGKYNEHYEKGTYKCRRCGAELYRSEDKFSSGCGWPSFDDEISGAVKREADGQRTEIICASCGAHLGHVFSGEGFTEKNTRHCVNSISLEFEPASEQRTAYVAGGCFWGVEHYMQKLAGVLSAESGYMGGSVSDPDYYAVSSGTTGHAETVKVVYDPGRVSYGEIIRHFFEIHDPTQMNRQGPDFGSQYRSAVFYETQEEKETVEELIRILKGKGYNVVTELSAAETFFAAERYHQDYYAKNGSEPYCHRPVKRF